MAFNPNIAMGYQPMQLKDPMQSYGQIAAIQNAQNQNALAQYQLGAAQRAEDQALALGNAWSKSINPSTGQVDRNTLVGMLASSPSAAGQIPAALKLLTESETSQAALQKTQGDVEKGKLENANTIRAAVGRGLVSLMGDQSDDAVNRVFGALKAQGFNADEYHKQLLSTPLEQRRSAVMGHIQSDEGSRKALEFVQPKPTEINLGGRKFLIDTNPYSSTFNQQIASFDVTATPGELLAHKVGMGNLAVNQGQLKIAQQNANKGQVVETENGPVLVNQRTGKVTALTSPAGEPLAGKGGAFTEGQTNAATFALRMRDASKVIDSLSSGDLKLASATPGLLTGALPESAQKAKQAKLDFITAVLRKESGAVIGPDEIKSNEQIYFPAVGDSDAVIQQKAQARRNALAGMESAAGKALQAAQKMRDKGQPQPEVDIEKLLNKYK